MVGWKNSSGYTLLEILVVLTLVAGVSFFLIHRIPNIVQEKDLDISATKLVGDLREMEQAALAKSSWFKIKFYPSTNEYKIFMETKHLRTVRLQPKVYFNNDPADLIILPTGVPNLGTTIILKKGNQERHIIVAPVMGRIRIENVRQ